MSESSTSDIHVKVLSRYLPEKSRPLQPMYVFAYDVTITNNSKYTVKLLSRYWRIRDAFGRIEEVDGPGVIGQQPILAPRDAFSYTSFCPLTTEFGSMEGYYTMLLKNEGRTLDVTIPKFQLVAPQAIN